MKIQLEPHTLQRAKERGATEAEIVDTLNNGCAIEAKRGRLGKSKIFTFNGKWNNKDFDQKKLEVYYIIDKEVIYTITVYVFFGNFGAGSTNIDLTNYAL